MKKIFKINSVVIGIYILLCTSLANAGAYYKTVEQPEAASTQIKASMEFSVLPIDYSAINPKDLGYTSNADWDADKNHVPQAFSDSFPILLKEANSNKKVTVIKSTDKPAKGIIAEVAVTKINLNWNYWTGRPDEYECKITFVNVADGQKLYSGVFNISTFSGNPFTHAWGASFSGRMQSAAYNMAWVLTKIMTDGKIDPVEY
ncbi:MAG: hypothetical protein JW925_05130 [Syntrophaceae bacterium]|nr:hypothetical protein [Syntrophaceae bacterium]